MKKMIGYRFHPTEEELVKHYLGHIHFGDEAVARNVINEIDICGSDPWELPSLSKIQYDEDDEQNVWYFFSESSKRGKRTTKNGYWKTTGKDREIRVCREVIGNKKTLVFYKGCNPYGTRTSWVMHEYHSAITPPNKKAYVVCKLKNKKVEKNPVLSGDGAEAVYPQPPDSDNHSSVDAIPEVILQGEEFLPEFPVDFGGLDDCLDFQTNEHDEPISALDPYNPIDSSYNHISPSSQEIFPSDFPHLDAAEGQEDEFVKSLWADQDDEDCSAEENTTAPVSEPISEPFPRLYPENTTNTETEALNSWIETPTQASSYTGIRDTVSDYSEIIPDPTSLKDTNQNLVSARNRSTAPQIKFKHMKRTQRCSNLNSPMQKIFKPCGKRTSCSSSLIQAESTQMHPVLWKGVPALCYKEVF